MTAVILPLGHYLGEYPDGGDGLEPGHLLRVGEHTPTLAGPTQLSCWALAHERPESTFDVTVADVLGTEGREVVTTLLRAGLLLRVTDDETERRAFARSHRLRPLLTALGRLAGDPERYAIGFAGQVTAVIDPQTHDLWWWSGPSGNLWELCVRVGAMHTRRPEALLDHFLAHAHDLLAGGAAYLDVA
ncbi:hypothetical protein GCM10027280_24600 [Micromonospora polyrhachis]|uniref:Uncharacterized protein n=1 Tax=Micromonospora polyrhachis TaxID=1282883 RepID=A0A7W7STU1_9ACTN|nr:hypothetical protein [Micromonospora polyrhachis]MBB4960446.1 hypothetical protein [Micromonospora polyrhachis]